MRKVLEYYQNLSFTNVIFYDHDHFINDVGTGPHVVTRVLQELTGFKPDGMPQTIELTGKRIRLEPACTFVLDDEPSGAYNYALHLYSAKWTDRAGGWADVVRREYDKWKSQRSITYWRG